jgi:micrococcal nuclease
VVRVIDGDTLVVGRGERIRLLGVDAPEMASEDEAAQPWAREATRYLKHRTVDQVVSLEYERGMFRDRYGRILAYVHLDSHLVNAELIHAGYARAHTGHVYQRWAQFLKLEREARQAERGLWETKRPVNPSGRVVGRGHGVRVKGVR